MTGAGYTRKSRAMTCNFPGYSMLGVGDDFNLEGGSNSNAASSVIQPDSGG